MRISSQKLAENNVSCKKSKNIAIFHPEIGSDEAD